MAQEETEYRVDLNKLDAFMAEKTKSAKCPFCEKDEWTLPSAGTVSINTIPWGKADGNMYMVGLPVLTMVCTTCYFVRMMAIPDPDLRASLAEAQNAE
ncbi:hypothetical protein QN366_05005 [Pseudomonas sp. CCC3.2]|uniref:hypothetical protein n=1 Tax=unclassified Pseudomonas TaxID=196821 RepID=UPI002AB5401F|nr:MULTISPECIES: hypothetical protein [unclassified Pseudomonas]MDY7559927.1 hypothetical protein [Pseudomonas sp. AB6]MEA9994569.1 hypothetical protein [Pseudomonas sp. AA4]MEB0085714.1 hypothetical protein [Pseudomonas sp. RTI1]MEB0125961.1 hypothetical protein [Pseudomonas sp. CCC1.2]MEB0152765.1 hypothetical protein [Pseudomonas sp. CCC4.3]